MKLKIERPDWLNLKIEKRTERYNENKEVYYAIQSYSGEECKFLPTQLAFLREWFDANVEPINEILSEVTPVYMKDSGKWSGNWSQNINDILYAEPTHKALLIDIKPIKKETAEDVLKEIINSSVGGASRHNKLYDAKLYEKAKAVLGESND